jgi:hypothetical protein
MIKPEDVILLLSELEKDGVYVADHILEQLKSNTPNMDAIAFINKHRQMDVAAFYEKIRKSYNEKHSTLYINIVKEIDDVNKVLTTLSALQTQLLLFYTKEAEDKEMFLRHSRASEISKVLLNYYMTYDLKPCIKLIQLIKADIKCLQGE